MLEITGNKEISEGFYRMRLESAYLAANSKPGQFVEVKCSSGPDPLLRRPLGIHRVVKGGIELLYKIIGRGTGLIARMKPGDTLDVIGPLGNGFDLSPHRGADILVAGGHGVAPLVALADSLVNSVGRIVDREKRGIHVFIGAKTAKHILCAKDFGKLGCDVHVATEDGSGGSKGLITNSLAAFLNTIHYPLCTTIYACGPTGMLKAVAGIAMEKHIPCQVSLEERMACGVGVCLGCPVKVTRSPGHQVTGFEYKMVCKDGPVFNAEDIAW